MSCSTGGNLGWNYGNEIASKGVPRTREKVKKAGGKKGKAGSIQNFTPRLRVWARLLGFVYVPGQTHSFVFTICRICENRHCSLCQALLLFFETYCVCLIYIMEYMSELWKQITINSRWFGDQILERMCRCQGIDASFWLLSWKKVCFTFAAAPSWAFTS